MAEEVVLDIDINAGNAPKTLGGLKKQIEQLNEELDQVGLHGDDFKRLSSELTAANKEVKNLELGFEALDVEQQASELGSVAGAVGDVTAAFVLLGGESDTMQQIAANVQQALGVSIAFKGAIEGVASARKLLNSLDKESTVIKIKDAIATKTAAAAQALYTFAVGTSTGALKLFRIALAATGIGLIIIAIGLLVANFDKVVKVVKDSVNSFLEFAKALGPVIVLMQWLTGQTQEQRKAEEEAAKQRRQSTKELAEQTVKRIKEIEAIRTAEAAAHKKRLTAFDLEIKRLDAQGKDSFAVTLSMLEDINNESKAVLQANADKLESYVDYYTNLAALRGQNLDDFKAQLLAQGVDLDAGLKKALENQQALEDAIFQSETDIIALKKKRSDEGAAISKAAKAEEAKEQDILDKAELKRIADGQKAAADDLKIREDIADKLFLKQMEVSDRLADFGKDEFQLKLEEAQTQFDTEMELFAENEEMRLELIQEYEDKVNEIRSEARQADEEEAEALREKRQAAILEQSEKVIGDAERVLSTLADLNSIASSREVARIKAKQQAGEQLTKSEIKRLKRQEAIEKAFAIAQIAIDTARGIAAAVAAGAGIPFPFNIPAILSGVAAVISGVAQANKIIGQTTPTATIDSDTSGSTRESDLAQDAPNTDLFQTGSTLLNQPNQRVFVLEQDITDTQDSVAKIEQQASFG